ncbi:cobalamin B12-binding domain-containing protein [Yoonia sp. SS1-5]|uniref:Cobalamin B12-binding domain-containing protein n=1 Tax=Yoonia rhodophyticola TaxID=3137370 RepID=A0AAN0MB29_9RHOB
MADHRNKDAQAPLDAPVRRLSAAPRVRDGDTGPSSVAGVDQALFVKLREAALSADREACVEVMKDALHGGLRPEDMADLYIPALARDMGQDWCEDQLGFAQVTIGVSRLQSMLRDLGPAWSADSVAHPAAPAIMLVVPEQAHHTLGAMVLAGQLRRKGLSVRLVLGMRRTELVKLVELASFDAVFISASCGERLETLRRIVDVIGVAASRRPPVVIGGSILDVEDKENVTALTGADYATGCPDEALRLCGLIERMHDDALMKRGV